MNCPGHIQVFDEHFGSLFISIPSAFTETTGKRHWHSLLKARAIENFCYIFA